MICGTALPFQVKHSFASASSARRNMKQKAPRVHKQEKMKALFDDAKQLPVPLLATLLEPPRVTPCDSPRSQEGSAPVYFRPPAFPLPPLLSLFNTFCPTLPSPPAHHRHPPPHRSTLSPSSHPLTPCLPFPIRLRTSTSWQISWSSASIFTRYSRAICCFFSFPSVFCSMLEMTRQDERRAPT